MGLLYAFPTSLAETDHVIQKPGSITLKSYGLPYLFWLYALVILTLYTMLAVIIWEPLQKLMEIGNATDQTLGFVFISLLILAPLAFLAFFFYEKRIISKDSQITIEHRLFFFKVKSYRYEFSKEHLVVKHFVDSPNMARIKDDRTLRAFYNQGYHELTLSIDNETQVFIDRNSRKNDLEKLKELIVST